VGEAKRISAKRKRKYRKHSHFVWIKVKRVDDPQAFQRKSKGDKWGLGVQEFLAVLFEANEQLPAARKLTDESILQALVLEYPKRPITRSLLERRNGRTINHYRQEYNRGKLTGTVPAVKSNRWTIKGEKANTRTGKPL
jgi:hypothetical protein